MDLAADDEVAKEAAALDEAQDSPKTGKGEKKGTASGPVIFRGDKELGRASKASKATSNDIFEEAELAAEEEQVF